MINISSHNATLLRLLLLWLLLKWRFLSVSSTFTLNSFPLLPPLVLSLLSFLFFFFFLRSSFISFLTGLHQNVISKIIPESVEKHSKKNANNKKTNKTKKEEEIQQSLGASAR